MGMTHLKRVFEYEYLVPRLKIYGDLHPATCTVAWTAPLCGTLW